MQKVHNIDFLSSFYCFLLNFAFHPLKGIVSIIPYGTLKIVNIFKFRKRPSYLQNNLLT